MAGGRPTDYTPELADTICAHITDGWSMRRICREDWSPQMTTIFRWLRENDEFRKQYEAAKDIQSDAFVEDILDIADTPAALNEKGGVDSGDVADKRLRIDTRKWIASKLKPKKYGEKVEQTMQGPDGGAIQADMNIKISFVGTDK
jgi:hypothetical protein